MPRGPLVWGAAGLVLVGLWAAWRTGRKLPTLEQARALVDRAAYSGGLLMASAETNVDAWAEQVRSVDVPVRWDSRRTTYLALAATVFLAVGFALPDRLIASHVPRPMDVTQTTDHLDDQIEVLEEEELLEEQQAQRLREQLEKLAAEARADEPVRTLEALDYIQDKLKQMAERAGTEAVEAARRLAQTEALAETLKRSEDQLSPQTLAESMGELAAMARQALDAGQLPEAALDPDTLKKLEELLDQQALKDLLDQLNQGEPLDAELLQQLAEACRNCQGGMQGQLGRLVDAGLLDPARLGQLGEAGQCDVGELVRMLEEQGRGGNCDNAAELMALVRRSCAGGRPGTGGITRGRGDAELTWGEKTDPTGTRFDPQALPPAELDALKNTQRVGLSSTAPKVNETGEGSTGGGLGPIAPGEGRAVTHQLLPRHRAAVQRYFDRDE